MELDGLSGDALRPESSLAHKLSGLVDRHWLPAGLGIEAVDGPVEREKMAKAGLHLDYRARLPGAVPTEMGVDFDPNNVRTQSWLLTVDAAAAGVMTVVVEPRAWLQGQKFLWRNGGDYTVTDCSSFTGGSIPRFAVVPGWANVLPEFRGRFGRTVGPILAELIAATSLRAPSDSWVMIGAAGHVPFEQSGEFASVATLPLGSRVSSDQLPVDRSLFGVAQKESAATVKFAAHIAVPSVPDVADIRTLGPTFVRAIR